MKGVCEKRDGYRLYSSASVSTYYEKLRVFFAKVLFCTPSSIKFPMRGQITSNDVVLYVFSFHTVSYTCYC